MDKDLQARQEARDLAIAAEEAQKQLARMDQSQLDRICHAVSLAFAQQARSLAEMAVQETGFGNVADKITKNEFASKTLWDAIKNMRVVGVLKEDPMEKLWQIGVPVGVIAAIVPSTNPTSTVCYKSLIALKSGNSIVFSPHPSALQCTLRAVQIVAQAAQKAGAPAGCVSCLTVGSMAGVQELMVAPQVRLILATGGPAMVKAAYSSGTPAIGVGAGNGPAYIHKSADVEKAIAAIVRSKTFDNGTVCASEQSIIVEKDMEQIVRREGARQGLYFLDEAQAKALAAHLFRPGGMNPKTVGKSAQHLAHLAGFSVPDSVKVLVAPETKVGLDGPYSREKLCPVLGLFVEENMQGVLNKSLEILHHEGRGHTFSIHAEDMDVIKKFAMEIPVSRFLVNTPAALGGIGATTGLFPALTLGCGAVGGSSSSNNISPLDLINIRRVAWDQEEKPKQQYDENLIDLLASKILEKLR